MIDVTKVYTGVIKLGQQYDSNVKRIEFDCSKWLQEFPEGVVMFRVINPQEKELNTWNAVMEENVAVWTITDEDTEKAGSGEVQLAIVSGSDTRKLSQVYRTKVFRSIPEPEQVVINPSPVNPPPDAGTWPGHTS